MTPTGSNKAPTSDVLQSAVRAILAVFPALHLRSRLKPIQPVAIRASGVAAQVRVPSAVGGLPLVTAKGHANRKDSQRVPETVPEPVPEQVPLPVLERIQKSVKEAPKQARTADVVHPTPERSLDSAADEAADGHAEERAPAKFHLYREPWHLEERDGESWIVDDDNRPVDIDIARVVACVNACSGLSSAGVRRLGREVRLQQIQHLKRQQAQREGRGTV